MKLIEECPNCGSADVAQDKVDVFVGTTYGPACCRDCGWDQEPLTSELINQCGFSDDL